MFCAKCGTQLPATAAFCSKCGQATDTVPPAAPVAPKRAAREAPLPTSSLEASSYVAPTRNQPASAITDEDLLRAAIRTKVDYYVPRMQRYIAGTGAAISWNWPSFFVSCYWALYRKSWLAFLLFLLLPIVTMTVSGIIAGTPGLDTTTASLVTLGSMATIWLLPPLFANKLYFLRIRKLLQEAQKLGPDRQVQLEYVAKHGGTSNAGLVLGVTLGGIAFVGILAAIALPAYEDFVVRSKVGGALAAVRPLQDSVEMAINRNQSLEGIVDLASIRNLPNANYLSDVEFDANKGVLLVTFSADLSSEMAEKSVALVPYRTTREPNSPIAWNCKNVDALPKYLPSTCRDK